MPFREKLLRQARERLHEFLCEIKRTEESEFPYEQSAKGLEELRKIFQYKLERLKCLDKLSDPATVKQECARALRALTDYLPILGIMLRSTHVRNAFEIYGPLLRLARLILDRPGPSFPVKTQLVISSGWDYSPFIYFERA